MDKKELNDLIDRVVLTGPGGVDRIKKILKEIANGSESGGSGSGCQCLTPMVVYGTVDTNGYFVPGDGAPTWAEARAHMSRGGLVYMSILSDGEPGFIGLAYYADSSVISGPGDEEPLVWPNQNFGGGDEPTVS